jgi:uncharacterized membrane protein YfcA
VTKIVATLLHLQHSTIDWRWVRRLACGSVPGVLAGSTLVMRADLSPDLLRLVVGLVLIASASAAVYLGVRQLLPSRSAQLRREPSARVVAGLGLVIGLMVGATSAGSGSLVDIVLVLYSRLKGPRLVGTGVAHAVLISSIASSTHWRMGTVEAQIVLPLLLGSVPGAILGVWLARKIAVTPLRWIVTALVFISGATLITQVTLK